MLSGVWHPRVDQSPRAMAIDKVNVDDRRPHRQRQKKILVDTGVDLNYFGRHLLLFRRSVFRMDLRPCASVALFCVPRRARADSFIREARLSPGKSL